MLYIVTHIKLLYNNIREGAFPLKGAVWEMMYHSYVCLNTHPESHTYTEPRALIVTIPEDTI